MNNDFGRAKPLSLFATEYVPNELLMKTVRSARNDDLPHFLDASVRRAASANHYGDQEIDGVLSRMGAKVASINRVFVPRQATQEMFAHSASSMRRGAPIPANYEEDEDEYGLSRIYKVTLENHVDVWQVCEALSLSNAVERAHPNYISRLYVQPNDPFYALQWGLLAIHCEQAWEIETGHPDVKIAIVDSGVDLDHDDLAAKLLPGQDFVDYQGSGGERYNLLGDYTVRDHHPDDEDGHGTHCAGIAAAISNNKNGIAGICWEGKILPVRVMFRVFDKVLKNETSVGTDADIDAGIKYAVDAGAHVINLSLGGYSESHESVLNYAHDKNVAVLAALGNDGVGQLHYPAANPFVLAVGAVDSNLLRWRYSNYGKSYRHVMAPGVDIGSTYRDNGYMTLTGTSMAAPHVTGVAALAISYLMRRGVMMSVDDLYDLIRQTADSRNRPKDDAFYGCGVVDAQAALQEIKRRVG
jgi:subtilisin family serine protease